MASVSFNARERRLVVESFCWPEDAAGLADAIEAFSEPASGLIVDLTRMPYIPAEVAQAIGDACRCAERQGCRVRVWTAPEAAAAAQIAPSAQLHETP